MDRDVSVCLAGLEHDRGELRLVGRIGEMLRFDKSDFIPHISSDSFDADYDIGMDNRLRLRRYGIIGGITGARKFTVVATDLAP